MSTLWVDIEADMFAISRVHEYVMRVGEYKYCYESRLDLCIKELNQLLDRLQGFAPNHELMVCLGHSTNFRYAVYPDYKSNRRGIQKAACYTAFRAYAQGQYNNTVLPGVEADDVLGVMYRHGDLLYSPDKDLRTIAGDHLLANGEVMTVPRLEADRAFFKQVLVGDSSDGYPGLPGCGDRHKMFASEEWLTCTTEQEFWLFVQKRYALNVGRLQERFGSNDPFKLSLQMARCARILRPGEYDFMNERPVLWEGPS